MGVALYEGSLYGMATGSSTISAGQAPPRLLIITYILC